MKTLELFTSIAAKVTNYISFPNLGIDEIKINEVAFTIPGTNITVAWYGLIIMFGIIVAFTYVLLMGKKRSRLITDDLLDIAIFTVLPAIVGARLYYVFFDWLKNPSKYESLYDVVAVWEGGLAIYGAIIFGAIGCFLTLRHKKIRVPLFFDYLCPAVMIAQSIGRWGNFANGEAYGSSTTSIFAMSIRTVWTTLAEDGKVTELATEMVSNVHPTFLYESMWNLVGFALLTLLIFRKKYDGQVALGYFAWYGAGRMIIEGLRQDSLYIGGTGIRVSQLLAFVSFIVASALFVFFTVKMIKIKGKKVADSIYLTVPTTAGEASEVAQSVQEGSTATEAEETAQKTETETETKTATETEKEDSNGENN